VIRHEDHRLFNGPQVTKNPWYNTYGNREIQRELCTFVEFFTKI
jgi:hypothetical protein